MLLHVMCVQQCLCLNNVLSLLAQHRVSWDICKACGRGGYCFSSGLYRLEVGKTLVGRSRAEKFAGSIGRDSGRP